MACNLHAQFAPDPNRADQIRAGSAHGRINMLPAGSSSTPINLGHPSQPGSPKWTPTREPLRPPGRPVELLLPTAAQMTYLEAAAAREAER